MTTNELWARLEAYASAYLPQWTYDRDGPESEAALLTAMGLLLEDSLEQLNRVPEVLKLAYFMGFGLGRWQQMPAKAYAALSAPDGRLISAGTEFYLSGDGTRVWRTEQDAWAEAIQLTDLYLSGGDSGKLISLPLPTGGAPVRLFDFRMAGAQRRTARFSHPFLFSTCHGCQVTLRFPKASSELLAFLSSSESVSWSLDEDSLSQPLAPPIMDGDSLTFQLPPSSGGTALVAQAVDGCIPPKDQVGPVFADTDRVNLPCDLIATDDGVCAGDSWLPFGEDPEPWNVCQIACVDVFSLRRAEITASWTVRLQQWERLIPGSDQEPEYKIVMRSLPPAPPTVKDVYVDTVAWEYWTGSGWLPVPGMELYASCFGKAADADTRMEVHFSWPSDAASLELQSLNTFWLRWRVKGAEGYGWMPRCSHAPEITGLCFSAQLKNESIQVEHICGLEPNHYTPVSDVDSLFPPLTRAWDECWFGFDAPPCGDILSVYLSFNGISLPGRFSVWEQSPKGIDLPLIVEDGTNGLSHDGVLTISGITGTKSVRFGKDRWWLCIRDEGGSINRPGCRPWLNSLTCGAVCVEASNTDQCLSGEALQPLRGGMVSGKTLTESFGGWPAESEQEWKNRAEEYSHHLGSAVSGLDIDQLLRGAFRDIAQVRCVREGEKLQIGVLMRDVYRHNLALSLRKPDILALLEQSSVVPSLGLECDVMGPRFYAIQVTAWIRLTQETGALETKRTMSEVLGTFLHPVTGGFGGNGWPMGTLPTELQLRSWLQAHLPGTTLLDMTVAVTTPEGKETDLPIKQDSFALPIDYGRHVIKETRV